MNKRINCAIVYGAHDNSFNYLKTFKVFCVIYKLIEYFFNQKLVAKLSNEKECGRRGGCNYHITFEGA